MKRCILLSIMIMGLIISSLAQKPEKKSNSPKEDVRVNREYDEQSNLIKFDSVYSYSWSSDTTLLKSLSPEDFANTFDQHFDFLSDSTFNGKSFFDDFDQFFTQPFGKSQDSLLMKEFDLNPEFHNFRFNVDSLVLNLKDFDNFFYHFRENNNDSISSKSQQKTPLHSNINSMDGMMEMLEQQMLEMEQYHRKFFKEQPKGTEL